VQALGWQPAAARLAAMRTAAAEPWLKARVDMARYVHVPLGNIETDWILFSMDAFFARALREHDMVSGKKC
jgi:DNA polymerase epsilon subunit 1